MWGVEQSGPQRSYRVLQKRGVIIDAEDYLPVTGTYPEHPISKNVPQARNMEELRQLRRKEYIESIDGKTKAYENSRKAYASQDRTYIKSEYLLDKPPALTSIKQKRELSKVEARRREGLTDGIHDLKDTVREPSLNFITNPKMFTKAMLSDNRRA